MKSKKAIIIFVIVCLWLFGYNISSQEPKFTQEAKNYFLEIAIGNEYGDNHKAIKKWNKDINIFIDGEKTPYLEKELNKITEELNNLIIESGIKLSIVDEKAKSNFSIFFGSGEDYAKRIEPASSSYISGNWGLFWCYWNDKFQIEKGSMYVDITKVDTQISARHILREELTQSLGLMNESDTYRTSIFYNGWSTTTAFSIIDREVIKILYNNKIREGMTKNEVREILNSL